MTLTYFKRYRMQFEIADLALNQSPLPEGVVMIPWSDDLVRSHARVKHESFRNEIDATVFPCLAQADGCLKLMNDIRRRSNFVAEATYLAALRDPLTGVLSPVGTIQGLLASPVDGAIQNIGIVPQARGKGIGRALITASLGGFAMVGCSRVQLEVTTQNTSAIRLYERIGFKRIETVLKMSDVQMA